MGLGDPNTCVYQYRFEKEDTNDIHILQYFVM